MINIKNNLKDSQLYKCHELSLVAALIAWNFTPIGLERSDPQKVTFLFNNTSSLQKAIQAYWDETDQVAPKKYFFALREAKSRIHGGYSDAA